MNFNKDFLISGKDIPFADGISIHQPTFEEISEYGEIMFWDMVKTVLVDEENLRKYMIESAEKDWEKIKYENCTYLQLFCELMNRFTPIRFNFLLLSSLLFPNTPVYLKEDEKDGQKDVIKIKKIAIYVEEEEKFLFNNDSFSLFMELLREIFMVNKSKDDKKEFNPVNEMAEKIASKMLKSREKTKVIDPNKTTEFMLAQYILSLSIGLKIDLLTLNKYTIPQILLSYERFQYRDNFDTQKTFVGAGATDIEFTEWEKIIF